MAELERQTIRPVGVYGIQRESSIDSSLIPQGGITEAVNFHFDRIGAAITRPGITRIGNTMSGINGDIVALHNASGTALLIASSAGNVWRHDPEDDTWSNSGMSANDATKIRFVDFSNRTLRIPVALTGSYASMAVNSFDYQYSASSANGNRLNIAQFMDGGGIADRKRASFGETYKSKIYLAGDPDNKSRLYFSSIISSLGEINWNPTVDFVDISPGDGEDISGLKRYSLELDVFKPNYIYRFKTSGLDPDPLIRIGTRSQESIIEGKRGLYFHHDTGFYRYSGGYPEEISRPIADIVDAIPFGQRDDVGAWKDSDHIYWTLAGDITVTGPKGAITIKRAVVRYTESSDVWTVYSYAYTIGRGGPYITATSSSIIVAPNTPLSGGGLSQGFAAEFNKGIVDATSQGSLPINLSLITKWYEWGGIENTKFIQQMVAIAEKGMGMNIMYQVNDYEDWTSLTPDLRKLITLFDVPTKKFNRIRFKVAGVSNQESAVFMGLDIIKGTNEGLVKK